MAKKLVTTFHLSGMKYKQTTGEFDLPFRCTHI